LNGKIDKTTWSYNTALMMKAGKLLSQLDQAAITEPDPTEAARKAWLESKEGLIKDDMAFAHLLFEALLDRGFPDAGKYLRGLHERVRDGDGHYGNRWDQIASNPRRTFRLIDQASAARAYLAGHLAKR
jgi:hypothetical protein